ncbi:MAG: type II toxin-antitoxin system RelE/ParE family toxin [Alloalcanivorax venustensis]|jgi:putative addiction module killer protein|uniref:type II toxin-antitoxin system RelE/ParE family toxin n=1 Tax=Gammaproteobacteria TaxID=1236 RepID=UPI000C5CFEB8|nr:addiction module protein [Alcanivorax sp.]
MYTRVYTGQPVTVFATQQFDDWMGRLKDAQGKSRIAARIRRISLGNMGDIKSVGGGVSELRIHTGPGYRVYLTLRGQEVVILLVGGDKSSQSKDIKSAKALAKQYQEES